MEPNEKQPAYYLTDRLAVVARYIGRLPANGAVYVDTETDSLDWITGRLLLVQLWAEGLPVLIVDCRALDLQALGAILQPVFTGRYCIVGHNLKFEYVWLAEKLGIRFKRLYDTMLAESVLTAGTKAEKSLKAVARKYAGVELDKATRLHFQELGDTQALTPEMLDYAALDVLFLPAIMRAQIAQLQKWELMDTARLEFQVLPFLGNAQLTGVLIDKPRWRGIIAGLEKERDARRAELEAALQPAIDKWRDKKLGLARIERENKVAEYQSSLAEWEMQLDAATADYIKTHPLEGKKAVQAYLKGWRILNPRPKPVAKVKELGGPINLDSPEQVKGALSEMGLEFLEDTGGAMQTDKQTLTLNENRHPLIKQLLAYRKVAKLVTSFGETILDKTDAAGRLHPEHKQDGTDTGRMSCTNPNTQQIPRGSDFRTCFIAGEGKRLVSADYSQIELRVLAYLANEPNMLEAFQKGEDLHSLTAAKMFNLPLAGLKEQHAEKRTAAKAINFGIAYGLSAYGLARQLNIERAEAENHINAYFAANRAVRSWLDTTAQIGLKEQHAATVIGRKRFFPALEPAPPKSNRAAFREWEQGKRARERAICNMPVQGTAADCTKAAIVRFGERMEREGIPAPIVLVVHDEIVVETDAAQAEYVGRALKEEMISAAAAQCPGVVIDVEYSVDDYWHH